MFRSFLLYITRFCVARGRAAPTLGPLHGERGHERPPTPIALPCTMTKEMAKMATNIVMEKGAVEAVSIADPVGNGGHFPIEKLALVK